ncbi:MAG: hypothetical protein IPN43_11050 [Chitinophagaceae bacterium]|nr:hypothetical protein [Chitinophagaceae bacterium]
MNHYYSKIFILASLVAIASCQNIEDSPKFKSNITPTSVFYNPDKLIDSISKVFLDSANCKNCLNELYIDKVYEDETYLTFKAKEYYQDYFVKNKPLFSFLVKDKIIYVFTGAESFIVGDQKNADTIRSVINTKEDYFLLMAFHLTEGSINMVRVANSPFTPQLDQFVPSDSSPLILVR